MRIRKLNKKDAPYMLEWMHDCSVTRFLKKDFSGKTTDDCLKFIEGADDETVNLHLAVVNDADEYMGTVSLKQICHNTAELGIVMRKCAIGEGYASFCLKEIIAYSYRNRGIDEIYWCTDPENIRAVRFFDNNGFSRSEVPEQAYKDYTEEEREKYIWYCLKVTEEMCECLTKQKRCGNPIN